MLRDADQRTPGAGTIRCSRPGRRSRVVGAPVVASIPRSVDSAGAPDGWGLIRCPAASVRAGLGSAYSHRTAKFRRLGWPGAVGGCPGRTAHVLASW
jgi:hypothetical protein